MVFNIDSNALTSSINVLLTFANVACMIFYNIKSAWIGKLLIHSYINN